MIEEDDFWTTVVFAIEPCNYSELVIKTCEILDEVDDIHSYHFKIQSVGGLGQKACIFVAFRIYSKKTDSSKKIGSAIKDLRKQSWIIGSKINSANDPIFNDGWLTRIKRYAKKWKNNFSDQIGDRSTPKT